MTNQIMSLKNFGVKQGKNCQDLLVSETIVSVLIETNFQRLSFLYDYVIIELMGRYIQANDFSFFKEIDENWFP